MILSEKLAKFPMQGEDLNLVIKWESLILNANFPKGLAEIDERLNFLISKFLLWLILI